MRRSVRTGDAVLPISEDVDTTVRRNGCARPLDLCSLEQPVGTQCGELLLVHHPVVLHLELYETRPARDESTGHVYTLRKCVAVPRYSEEKVCHPVVDR